MLDVIVQGPEVLNCAEGDDGSLVLLPVAVPVVLEEPQGPFVLKKVQKLIFFQNVWNPDAQIRRQF